MPPKAPRSEVLREPMTSGTSTPPPKRDIGARRSAGDGRSSRTCPAPAVCIHQGGRVTPSRLASPPPVTAKTRRLAETQAERKGLHLDRGCAFVIPDQQIGDLQRQRIHGAARRDADVAIARAAEILDGVQGAGVEDLDHSSILSGRKRTVSPGAMIAGTAAVGSNI